MSKSASIQKILDIQPIANADAIEVATILGWKVVIKKDSFKVGDMCVYCEIDTVCPEKPEFEFLRDKKFRIRTCRLRGQISQGICFPMSILPEGSYVEGQDVSELVGIIHYEKPIPLNMSGLIKGSFPSYVPKTDEIMIQSDPSLIEELRNKDCYISLKINGTSATFSIFNGEIDVCSRNISLKESEGNIYWKMFKENDIEGILGRCGKNIAIQGEIAGPGIQENMLQLEKHKLFVFNVYDIDKAEYLGYSEFIEFCEKNNLTTVPIICNDLIFDLTLDQLLIMAKGFYPDTKNHREGIVIRPLMETYSNVLGGRLSVKVLNNDYLEKEK